MNSCEPNFLFQFHEVALEYNNCQNGTKVDNILEGFRQYQWELVSHHLDLAASCRLANKKSRLKADVVDTQKCCVSMMLDALSEPSRHNSCNVCLNYYYSHYPYSCRRLTSYKHDNLHSLSFSKNECTVILPNYNPKEFLSLCCADSMLFRKDTSPTLTVTLPAASSANSKKPKRTPLSEHSDPYIKQTAKYLLQKQCQRLRKQHLNAWKLPFDSANLGLSDNPNEIKITGLGCDTNKSLTFFAMDSTLSHVFSESLGLDLGEKLNHTALVLFDKQVFISIERLLII